MSINRITSFASNVTGKIGETIINSTSDPKNAGNILRKVNGVIQGEGINPGRGAYHFMMWGCVIVPRLLEAREPDEFREILTRDVTTVATMLFAMKGIKAGMCASAQKEAGMNLVSDTVGHDAGTLKRLAGYINPEGGIMPLQSGEIVARYSNIKDKETLLNMLKTLDKEGGHIGKMFSVEKQEGIFDKVKRFITNDKSEKSTPLLDAAAKMFQVSNKEELAKMSNADLIKAVEKVDSANPEAYQGMLEIIGTSSVNAAKQAGMRTTEGILNKADNPITDYARRLSANLETMSLGVIVGFLGLGLPKINEITTKKKHLGDNAPVQNRAINAQNNDERNYADYYAHTTIINKDNIKITSQIYNSIGKNNNENPFINFLK